MKHWGWLPVAGLLLSGAAPEGARISVAFDGLRSAKGRMLVCVTRHPDHFPDCSKDPDKRHFSIASVAGPTDLGPLPPGDYAIAVIHDENANGKMDFFMAIPREGVGFSRNPALRFGPPAFKSAVFPVAGAPVTQTISLKYFL
jgi:uncharacterized protein (DUF2141 family)